MNQAVYSWSRFRTPSLSIAAALVGASHTFEFEGRDVHVELPGPDRAGDDLRARLVATTRRTADRVPLVFDVNDVDVLVDQPDSPEIQDILEANERGAVNDPLVGALGDLAERAFSHWLRVMRWRTRHWRIGRLGRHQRTTWGTHLRERDTHQVLAPGVTTIVVAASRPVTVEEWADVQEVLTLGTEPPLFYDLYFDGSEHLASGDSRRAVVDFANACEVLLKTLLDRSVPQGLIEPAKAYLLRAQANVLLDRFGPVLLDMTRQTEVGQHRRDLEQLFAARNDALHSHRPDSPTQALCVRFSVATRALLEAGAKALGLP